MAAITSLKNSIISESILLIKRQNSKIGLLPNRSDTIPVRGLPIITPAIYNDCPRLEI